MTSNGSMLAIRSCRGLPTTTAAGTDRRLDYLRRFESSPAHLENDPPGLPARGFFIPSADLAAHSFTACPFRVLSPATKWVRGALAARAERVCRGLRQSSGHRTAGNLGVALDLRAVDVGRNL